MAFRVSGLSDLIDDFAALAQLNLATKNEMLRAGADVVVSAQQRTAKNMLKGPYSVGQLAGAIVRQKPKVGKNGPSILVIFKGTAGKNKKYSLGYIAFINEFGKTNQPARPFIKAAIEQSAEEVVRAEAEVLDDFIGKLGF